MKSRFAFDILLSRPAKVECLLVGLASVRVFRGLKFNQSCFGEATNRLAACAPELFPGINQFLEPRSLPATAGKLRLHLGNLDKFMAAGLLVSGNAGLCVTAQTLDPAGATQE